MADHSEGHEARAGSCSRAELAHGDRNGIHAGPVGKLADVATAVPGVARLTAVPGSRQVRVEDHDDPSGRHIEVQLAVARGHHPLEVARAVRAAVADAATTDAPGPVTVAVLITETAS